MEYKMSKTVEKNSIVEEIIDLEEYAKADRKPPRAKSYRIRIDKKHYVVHVPAMTGRELLNLAGKTPASDYVIFQHVRGKKPEKIGLDEKADFTTPGVERFRTIPVDQTEGEGEILRRQFQMPATDREFLETRGLPWEAIIEANTKWLLVHDFPVTGGYTLERVTAALMITAGYPDAQIDMVYFYPPLVRLDNKAIKALANQNIEGKLYQRWSRHRTAQNPWRPGEDDVSTHLAQVEYWLEKELKG
jgi:hypothetical protein